MCLIIIVSKNNVLKHLHIVISPRMRGGGCFYKDVAGEPLKKLGRALIITSFMAIGRTNCYPQDTTFMLNAVCEDWFNRTKRWFTAIIIAGAAVVFAQDTAWVDQDASVTYGDGTNDRAFVSLDSVLSAIELESYDVEVIVFAGQNQHTYNWTKYVGKKPGTIKFVGAQDDPNLFPEINHTDGSTYNLGNDNSLTFEKVTLSGSLRYELGNSTNTHIFQQCIFKNNTGTCAIMRGDGGGVTRFENCLFVNNTCDNLFDISFDYGGTVSTLTISNCTFDGNGNIWSSDETEVTNVTITNCIFSNNGILYRGDSLRGKTTYSLTSESTSDYGNGCIQSSDPFYVESNRSAPDDWRPLITSLARNLGIASGTPSVDISDTIRIQDTTDRRDAGCWDIRDTVSPPVITQNIPHGDTLLSLESVLTLSVTASGSPPFNYSWYIVGNETKISTESSCTFNTLTVNNDNNKVYCLVGNSKDTVSSDTTTIVVLTTPVITSDPVPMTAYEGDDVTFTVVATGKQLIYTWTKNGYPIPGATAATYQKSSVTLSDSASMYICIVSNLAGSVTSKSALLEVLHDEPQITELSNDTTVMENNPLTLYCEATGRSPLEYAWYQPGTIEILSETNSLIVPTTTVTNGVVYRCIVTNSIGVDSGDVTVVVTTGAHPVFTVQPLPNKSVPFGQACTLSVSAEGGGIITYVWYKNGLTENDRAGDGPDLIISDVNESDTGIYQCIAYNAFGSDTSESMTLSLVTVTDSVTNTLSIQQITFDPATNIINCIWTVDTTGVGAISDLEVGIVWTVNEPPSDNLLPGNMFGTIISDPLAGKNSTQIILGQDLVFSSVYHFAFLLRLKNGPWAKAVTLSRGTVEIPAPEWQVITYFTDHDTIRAFGNTVWLRKISKNPISITDTIMPFLPEKTPDGFIVVSTIGFDLAQDRKSDPIAIGFTYDNVLVSSYSVNDIRLYQYRADDNEWITIHDVSIDKINNIAWAEICPAEYPYPFLCMIDTVAPSVAITSDTARPVKPGFQIIDTVIVKDNSVNCLYTLSYWFPDEIAGRVIDTCAAASDTVIITIPQDSVTTRNSIRAFLTVSDGVDASSIIISRKVKRTDTDPFISLPGAWVPVFTTSILDSPQVEVALKKLGRNRTWEYDSKEFRMFRWVETYTNNTDSSLWIEYSKLSSTYFRMMPGRVLWLKTRDRMDITTLGTGTTVGVREPFEIVCYGDNQWTDLALPYQFDVTINDIIKTTGERYIHNNIAIYQWVRDNKTGMVYTAPKYIPGVIGFNDPNASLTCGVTDSGMGTYTMFNGGTDPLLLKIPPIPATFSRDDYGNAEKKKQLTGWSILVKPTVVNEKLTPICCGFSSGGNSSGGNGMTMLPSAPSFNRQHVAIMDAETNSRYGTMVYHETNGGGTVFPLAFTNGSDSITRFSFEVERLTTLPKEYSIALCQSRNNISMDVDVVENVTVASHGTEMCWLLVGDSTYITTWKHQTAVGLDNLHLNCYPNPFSHLLHVQFYLPAGSIDRIRFSMINQLGQRVWKQELNGNQFVRGQIQRVMHSYTVHPRLSAGTYILNMQVLDKAGGGYSRRQRVLYLPH